MNLLKIIALTLITSSSLGAEIKVVTEYIYPTEYTITPMTSITPDGRTIVSGGIVTPVSFNMREVGVWFAVEASMGNLNSTIALIPSLYNNNPLIIAASLGDVKGVKNNIKKYNVNAKNKYGSTAIMGACTIGNEDVVKILIANGANVNVTNQYGLTPLLCAIKNNHNAVAKLLK